MSPVRGTRGVAHETGAKGLSVTSGLVGWNGALVNPGGLGLLPLGREQGRARIYDAFAPSSTPSRFDDDFSGVFPALPSQKWVAAGVAATSLYVGDDALQWQSNATGSSFNVSAIEQDLPPGVFSVSAFISHRSLLPYGIGGIHVRSSSSNKMIRLCLSCLAINDPRRNMHFSRMTDFTNRTSTVESTGGDAPKFMFMRLTYNGTNIYGDFNETGHPRDWYTFFSEALTSHFSGGLLPDKMGISMDPFTSTTNINPWDTGNPSRMTVRAFRYFPSFQAIPGQWRTLQNAY